jgi:hypothetical protein
MKIINLKSDNRRGAESQRNCILSVTPNLSGQLISDKNISLFRINLDQHLKKEIIENKSRFSLQLSASAVIHFYSV